MPRAALLAAIALAVAIPAAEPAAAAGAAVAAPLPMCRAGAPVQRAVVMFGLPALRRHLLDTLTELIGGRGSSGLPQGCGLAGRIWARAPS